MLQPNDGLTLRSGQDGDDYRRDSIERDEKRLAELGRRTVEMYVICHIFTEKLEVAYREAEALKRQDQLIAEEFETARMEESKAQAKAAADKEKKAKKKVGTGGRAGWARASPASADRSVGPRPCRAGSFSPNLEARCAFMCQHAGRECIDTYM